MKAGNARPALPEGLGFWSPTALISTWFGTGLLPAAPGTWGSLAALPIAWVVADRFGPFGLIAVGLVLFLAGLWAVGRFLHHGREKDPGMIVIDEVAGQILAVVPAGLDPLAFALGFVLFRVFDIMKPWPVRAVERSLDGALGVMADDIMAALYAAIFVSIFMIILERPNVFF